MSSSVAVWSFTALVLLSLAAPATAQGSDPQRVRTQSGQDLGPLNLQDITEAESGVRFTNADDVSRRQQAILSDRRVEGLTLRNEATLIYTKPVSRSSTFGPANYDPAASTLKSQARTKYLDYYGFVFDERAIKRAGRVAYEIQKTKLGACFIYGAFLGDGINLTQEIHGTVCHRGGDGTAEALEREMLSLLSHARFAQPLNGSDFSVTLEIPAAQQ